MEKLIPEGLLVTFEGPDGSGKSTQTKLLAKYLEDCNYKVFLTHEPGGTEIGDQVREVLHSLRNVAMHPKTEVLGYNMSRAQLVEEKIKPSLKNGNIVVCDRYADSTRAYQIYGHMREGVGIESVINFATGGLVPNLTLLFDLDSEMGLRRRASDGEWNRMDDMTLDFHKRVRAGYLEMASSGGRWKIIDASRSIDVVFEEVKGLVIACLGLV